MLLPAHSKNSRKTDWTRMRLCRPTQIERPIMIDQQEACTDKHNRGDEVGINDIITHLKESSRKYAQHDYPEKDIG